MTPKKLQQPIYFDPDLVARLYVELTDAVENNLPLPTVDDVSNLLQLDKDVAKKLLEYTQEFIFNMRKWAELADSDGQNTGIESP